MSTRSFFVHCCLLALAVFALAVPLAAEPASISDCAVSLVPQINITTLDEHTRYAWLNLVTEKTYESAKSAIKGSGDVQLLGLIKLGDVEASYDQFSEKRREYLELHKGKYEHDVAVSVFSQSLPPDAYRAWSQCVENVTRTPGLHAWFREDTRGTAVLYVRFFEGPTRVTDATITLSGAKERGFQHVKLAHDALWSSLVTRRGSSTIVANVTDGRFSDHAASALPATNDPSLVISPYTLTPLVAQPCAAGDRCALCVNNMVVTVEAPDADTRDASLLVDSRDARSQPARPQSFHERRLLDDVQLVGSGSLRVVMAGRVADVATLTPIEGCRSTTMRLPNSRVDIRIPDPVYQKFVTGPFTQDITLNRYGDFTVYSGNVGCPHCHESWVAQLIPREQGAPVNVERFERIDVVYDKQTGHWYSCMDGVCGVKHPDYTERRDATSDSCIGKSTCWVFRHGDDSHQATQTFRVVYYKSENRCVKNCPH